MRIKSIKKSVTLILVIFACIFSSLWISSSAIGTQVNQAPNNQYVEKYLGQPATLLAPNPNFAIKIFDQPFDRPNEFKNELGYGVSGDEITLLQQVYSNDSSSWYLVRFDNPAKTEGWVSGNYVSLIAPNNRPSQSLSKYLGVQKKVQNLEIKGIHRNQKLSSQKQGNSNQRNNQKNNQKSQTYSW
jgi:hypothetical protein